MYQWEAQGRIGFYPSLQDGRSNSGDNEALYPLFTRTASMS